MSSLRYSIVVDSGHIPDTGSIAKTAVSKGFIVDNVMPEIGAIFGHTEDSGVVDKVRHIVGVEDIRPSRDIQLVPFDEGIPQ
ncbi:hypothetical protein [Pararhizobium gei]|uniref:hypothetical protein n=1 Tax=Pararhizobium gei TaxID=1395951 RepID=UPI0023DBE345|nr:hypothetical protein [Rhizobium gei]